MILSGIYDATSRDKKLYKDKINSFFDHIDTDFETDYLYLATRSSSVGYEQNTVVKSDHHFLAGKVFSKSTYAPISKSDLEATNSHEEFVKI